MCGIFAILNHDQPLCNETTSRLNEAVDRRGPDYRSQTISHAARTGICMSFKSSILHLRGGTLQSQPMIDCDNNALLFNGEIYRYGSDPIDKDLSDTKFLADCLQSSADELQVAEVLFNIDGPFALVYWHEATQCLFYGRDVFGRKSLCALYTEGQKCPVVLSSLALSKINTKLVDNRQFQWLEVSCRGIHCLKFSNTAHIKRQLFLYGLERVYPLSLDRSIEFDDRDGSVEHVILDKSSNLVPLNCDQEAEFSECQLEESIAELEKRLTNAIKLRLDYDRKDCLTCRSTYQHMATQAQRMPCDHAKVAVAFSGGLDSTLIAYLLDKVMADPSETIDLTTVAFKAEAADRQTVATAYKELCALCPKRRWRLIVCDATRDDLEIERSRRIKDLIAPCTSVIDDSLGCACWFIFRGQGRACDRSILESVEDAFESFIKYNIDFASSRAEAAASAVGMLHESTIEKDKNKRHTTSMLSIDCTAVDPDYKSTAAIMFAGMGIDEQLCGYSAHRAAWRKAGAAGLCDEISYQMRRISYRNMGRDDRVCSDHARDLKLPYLDSEVVSFLNSLPVTMKADVSGCGDALDLSRGPKKILRQLALKCGLRATSAQVKKALQFGTKIAHLETGPVGSAGRKETGNAKCSRLE